MSSNYIAPEIRKRESVKTPNTDCEYLTSNKLYVVKKVFKNGLFQIKDDTGVIIHCKASRCGHLNGLDWIINN